jgi:hypothetical protein
VHHTHHFFGLVSHFIHVPNSETMDIFMNSKLVLLNLCSLSLFLSLSCAGV